MKRASYREAVAWIALNDETCGPEAQDPKEVETLISVALVADIFGVDVQKVAADVVRYRQKNDA